jgi:hypothetical protein
VASKLPFFMMDMTGHYSLDSRNCKGLVIFLKQCHLGL